MDREAWVSYCHFQKEELEHVFVDMSLLWAFASIPFPPPEKYYTFLLSRWCSPLGLFLLVPLAEVCWCHFCPSTAGLSLSLLPLLPVSDLCLLCCWLLLCLALQPLCLPFPFYSSVLHLLFFSVFQRGQTISTSSASLQLLASHSHLLAHCFYDHILPPFIKSVCSKPTHCMYFY